MTAQALAGALAGIALALIVAVVLLEHARRVTREVTREELARVRRTLEERLERARVELAARQADLANLNVRLATAEARQAEQELELAGHRSSPLVGQTVIANTARPDDQSIRGVVMRELDDDGLLLAGAVYLDTAPGRGDVVERPAGDVVVHRVSWTQVLHPEE